MDSDVWRAHLLALQREFDDGQQDDAPAYAYILAMFDRGVQAATAMQVKVSSTDKGFSCQALC